MATQNSYTCNSRLTLIVAVPLYWSFFTQSGGVGPRPYYIWLNKNNNISSVMHDIVLVKMHVVQ